MENTYMNQFDLRSMVKDVLRQWWVILLCALSVSMLTYVAVSMSYKPAYTTKTTFVVTSREEGSYSYRNLEAARDTADKLAQVLGSSLLQKAVMKEMEMDSFPASTFVTQVPETNMLEFSVTASSPDLAFKLTRAILKEYPKVSDYIIGKVNMLVLEQPAVPVTPSNPLNALTMMRKSFLLGLALMILIMAFLSFKRNTVKNTSQYRQKIDANPLGVIYHERKGQKQFVSRFGLVMEELLDLLPLKMNRKKKQISMLMNNPGRSFFYVESIRMVNSRIRSRMDQEGAKVALITSVMENEGKSTVSANIGLGIAEEGKKVLLIDGDFRKPSLYKVFGLEEDKQVNLAACLNDRSLKEAPGKQYKDTSLYLIANNTSDREAGAEISLDSLRMVIDYYRQSMDYIFIDTAPMALVSDTEALGELADVSILVSHEDMVLAPHINDSIDLLEQSGSRVLGCILNNAHKPVWGMSRAGYGGYGGYYGRRK